MSDPVTMFLHNFTHFPKLVIILPFTFFLSFLYTYCYFNTKQLPIVKISQYRHHVFIRSILCLWDRHTAVILSSISTFLWDFLASVLCGDPQFLKPTSSSFLVSLRNMSFSNFFEEECMRNFKCLRCCVWKCHYSTHPLMLVCLQIELQVEIYFPLHFDCIISLSSSFQSCYLCHYSSFLFCGMSDFIFQKWLPNTFHLTCSLTMWPFHPPIVWYGCFSLELESCL